ncbi:MAG: hypothetical protein LW834_22490 [Cyanobium sp. 49614_E6]|nr:hypothetical protein [Cyanobium sp. 49614_E6]
MASEDKTIETIKFLLTSVKKLSDTFVMSEGKVKKGFEGVGSDVDELRRRLELLERQWEERANSSDGDNSRTQVIETQLPVSPGTAEFRVPVLNLSVESILDVYANTPILLEPFSRPCSLTGRTLSGEIEAVELEVFAQGSTWVVESQPSGWLLFPRPGSLERKTSLQSLERLYTIEGVRQLPALLHLVRPAQLDAVVVGRRWQLREKGQLSVTPDPLRVGLTDRMASLESRLAYLEAKQGG